MRNYKCTHMSWPCICLEEELTILKLFGNLKFQFISYKFSFLKTCFPDISDTQWDIHHPSIRKTIWKNDRGHHVMFKSCHNPVLLEVSITGSQWLSKVRQYFVKLFYAQTTICSIFLRKIISYKHPQNKYKSI